LKLKYDQPLSNIACNFNLSRCAEAAASVKDVREKHAESLKRWKDESAVAKTVLSKAVASAKQGRLMDLDAARGAADRAKRWSVAGAYTRLILSAQPKPFCLVSRFVSNLRRFMTHRCCYKLLISPNVSHKTCLSCAEKWTSGSPCSVVVERHRELRKAGKSDERAFATSCGRQQAALGAQIAAAELRHRGTQQLARTTAVTSERRAEDAKRALEIARVKVSRCRLEDLKPVLKASGCSA
jgi:hypothetical protein